MASLALALAFAAPASATLSATGTLAPIGSGSYLVTVTNTGSETITGFLVYPVGFVTINGVPSPACQFGNGFIIPWIRCSTTVAPAASTQVCYTGDLRGVRSYTVAAGLVEGSAVGESVFATMSISPSPAVASCPLPGFTAGSRSTSGASGASGSSGTPGSSSHPLTSSKRARPWSHAQCKRTYKAWTKAHHHATRSQKKAEANKLHKTHGCPLSILK